MTIALLALAGALALWPPARATVRVRVHALLPTLDDPTSAPPVVRLPRHGQRTALTSGSARARRRRWALAAAAGLGAALLIGGPTGLVVGIGTAAAAERTLRRGDGRADADRRAAVLRDVPVACDLLAVCVTAGLPVGAALTAVGSAVSGPLGAQLAEVGALYRLGSEPRRAWAGVPAELAVLGRVAVRAGESGSAIQSALRTLAAEVRASTRTSTEAAVRRAGVWVLAPLGLCFLPAFVCLGVAPLVLGIARDVFG